MSIQLQHFLMMYQHNGLYSKNRVKFQTKQKIIYLANNCTCVRLKIMKSNRWSIPLTVDRIKCLIMMTRLQTLFSFIILLTARDLGKPFYLYNLATCTAYFSSWLYAQCFTTRLFWLRW